jgi:hypothetical protein
MRKIISPPPATIESNPSLVRLNEHFEYIRGIPSALVKEKGNLHNVIKPLRQALYARKKINQPVFEKYPDWDKDKNEVIWIEEKVNPDPALDYLLDDPD